ncbi:hypothetical protein AYL99_11724 [Fonsecaea erecta]|uniref:VWFA domain-containing protein n=1 Tax=Fonsecaea erecta TaxID=1367422 RepID=A0A178Z310_9EURO|nr:hypothetical protein AYL99_11724 [Fonsecaea erecta]OAP54189.1 hypothetical protein AYL99_11724 [Fonsecaea erecta]
MGRHTQHALNRFPGREHRPLGAADHRLFGEERSFNSGAKLLRQPMRTPRYRPWGPVKPLDIIVITDGVPSDEIESAIVHAARKLDTLSAERWKVGIQFFQVGREPEARDMLCELDDAWEVSQIAPDG